MHFSTCCISALPEFDSILAAWFVQSFWLTTHTLLYDSMNLIINVFSSELLDKRSRQRCRSWTVLHAQCTSALSSVFPMSQGNAEALHRWGGKTKHLLISYFPSNISAKNYVIGSCMSRLQQVKGGTIFWDTVYSQICSFSLRRAYTWCTDQRQAKYCMLVLQLVGVAYDVSGDHESEESV